MHLALSYEAQHYKLYDCAIKQVISHARTKAKEGNESELERALAKASLALEKQFGELAPWLLYYTPNADRPVFVFWCRPLCHLTQPDEVSRVTETRPCTR